MLTLTITVYLEATHQIHIEWYNADGHKRLPIPGLESTFPDVFYHFERHSTYNY